MPERQTYGVPQPYRRPWVLPQLQPEPIPYLARKFDDVDDSIDLAVGACSIAGAFTIAVLVRNPNRSGFSGGIFSNNDGATAGNPGLAIQTNGTLQIRLAGTFRNGTSTTAVLPANDWVIVVACKAAGSAAVRFHAYKGGAWSRENTAAVGDPTAQTVVSFDTWVLGSRVLNFCDMAVAGEWNVALSDAQVDELSVAWQTQDWMSNSGGAPVGLWDLNQATTATAVTDLTGNGANQTAITGTEVTTTGPVGWTFGATAPSAPEIPYLLQRPLVPA